MPRTTVTPLAATAKWVARCDLANTPLLVLPLLVLPLPVSLMAGLRSPARVVVLGPLPPPLHGMSLVTQKMAGRLQADDAATVIDVSPGAVYNRVRWRGRAAKIARLVRAWARLPALRLRGHRWLYLPLDSRWGLWLNLVTVALGRAMGFRVMLHHHVTEYLVRRHWALALIDRVIGPEGVHLFSCARFEDAFRRLYASKRLALPLSNAAFLERMEPPRAVPQLPRPLTLGHLSNLSREKGLHDVLDAFTALQRSGVDVRLVLAGPCHDAADHGRIDGVAAAHGTAFEARGPVTGETKRRFHADIDVFLFPTRYPLESEPMVVLEALQAGRPVIAFAEGCIAELIGDDGGESVPPGSDFTAACARVLSPWLGDRSALAHAQQAAQDRAIARIDMAEAQFAAVLAVLCDDGGASRAGRAIDG